MHPNARTLHSDRFIFHCEAAPPLTFSAWWCPDNVSLGWLRWMPEFWPLKTPCASCCGHVAFPRKKTPLGWISRLSRSLSGKAVSVLYSLHVGKCRYAAFTINYLNFAWRRRWALVCNTRLLLKFMAVLSFVLSAGKEYTVFFLPWVDLVDLGVSVVPELPHRF